MWKFFIILQTIGANKLWKLLQTEPYVHALGAITGNQAMQMVRAGLRAIHLSGKSLYFFNLDSFIWLNQVFSWKNE
jgi:isocitrate lyase